jgi:hypothetical protein
MSMQSGFFPSLTSFEFYLWFRLGAAVNLWYIICTATFPEVILACKVAISHQLERYIPQLESYTVLGRSKFWTSSWFGVGFLRCNISTYNVIPSLFSRGFGAHYKQAKTNEASILVIQFLPALNGKISMGILVLIIQQTQELFQFLSPAHWLLL